MHHQDLSGRQIKVVQYTIISIVPNISDNARVLVEPRVVAFADDMTPEDFTAWIIAENVPKGDPGDEFPCGPTSRVAKCWDRKYLRVAYTVMGRFNRAEIDWKELQALSVAKIAEHFDPGPKPCSDDTKKQAARAAAEASGNS